MDCQSLNYYPLVVGHVKTKQLVGPVCPLDNKDMYLSIFSFHTNTRAFNKLGITKQCFNFTLFTLPSKCNFTHESFANYNMPLLWMSQ
jgi:hypothetical protein